MSSFCAECGTVLEPDAKFCQECGASVSKTALRAGASPARGRRSLWLWVVVGGGAMLLLAGGLLFALRGWGDPDKRANQLFVEASQLVQAAHEAERTSYREAFKLYQAAQANLEAITARYPSSHVAVQLSQDQTTIGPYTIAEFREAVRHAQARAEAEEARAEAEEDPLMCALQVANTIVDAPQKAVALGEIALAYAAAGQGGKATEVLSQALQVVDTRVRAGWEDWTLLQIAGAYAKAGRCEQAMQVANTMADGQHKAMALRSIALAYAEAGQGEKAMAVLSQALQVANTITDPREKYFPLEAIAVVYARAGRHEQAMQVANSITGAWGKDWVFMHNIAVAYAKAGRYEQAMQVANSITGAWRKAGVLLEIAGAYAAAGQGGKATAVLSQALQVANTIAEAGEKASALGMIAGAYAEAGRYEQAMQVTNTLAGAGSKDIALHNIAGAYAKAGRYEQAIQVASTLAHVGLKARALRIIAVAYAAAGQGGKATAVLSRALLQVANTIAEPREKAEWKADALHGIVEACTKAGCYEQAIQVARLIEDANGKAVTLASIARGYAQAGRREEGQTRKVLHAIINAADLPSRP